MATVLCMHPLSGMQLLRLVLPRSLELRLQAILQMVISGTSAGKDLFLRS